MDAPGGRTVVRQLREQGFTVQADGDVVRISPGSRLDDDLRETVRETKPQVLAALRREQIEALLDLAPVDPLTGLPDLPADECATARQVDRLKELSTDPAFGDLRPRVREIVEAALDAGLSQIGAWGLLGELGRRIAARRHGVEATVKFTCARCRRRVDSTAVMCDRCRDGGRAVR